MEENYKKPGFFFNAEKLLVDREQADPFNARFPAETTYSHPYVDCHSTGYIQYTFRGNAVVILNTVVTGTR